MKRLSWTASVACVAGIVFAGQLGAAEWTSSKDLAVRGTYTDNLLLGGDGQEDAFFVEVRPGFAVRGDGRRLNLALAYSLQYLNYLSGDADDDLNHFLQANVGSELYKNHLYLDGGVTLRQELIDPLGVAGPDSTSPTGNLQTTGTYFIAPRYVNRFGRHGILTARFQNDGVFYEEEGDESIGYTTSVDVRSGPSLGDLLIGSAYEDRQVDYQDSRNDRYRTLTGFVGYQFSRVWRADGTVGYEENDYTSLDETDGTLWRVSVTWTPNPRTFVQAGTGKRYFGWTPSLDFEYRRKRSVWTANYDRDIENARNASLRSDVFVFEDEFGDPILPDTAESANLPLDTALADSSTFISNRFRAGYAVRSRRSSAGVTLGYTYREYEDSSQDQNVASVRVFGTRQLGRLTQANIGLGWSQREADGDGAGVGRDERSDMNFDAGLTRRWTPRTNLSLRYRLSNGEDYTENRVTLALQTSWQ